MLLIFAVLLVMNALSQVPLFLQEKLGIDVGSPYLVASVALSAETPLGTEVSAVNGGSYYGGSSGGEALGTFPPGSSLVLEDGPETQLGGTRWWYVRDPETGVAGWVPESSLILAGVNSIGPGTSLGTTARAVMDTSLWVTANATEKVGDIAKGTMGRIVGGPEERDGTRWWQFELDDGSLTGWIPESALSLVSGSGWSAGSRVRATRDVDLFERPSGGLVFGSADEEEALTIMGGPTLVGGEFWWLVETEGGVQGWVPESALEDGGFKGVLRGLVGIVVAVAVVITVVLLAGIMYATIRTNQIRAREARRIREASAANLAPKRNERWDRVRAHGASDNPNDWRLAIIEADIMLDELVSRMGYTGTTLGDKLKEVSRGDFKSIDAAWEAHRTRNQIAHEGSDFILTQREAKRILDLYERVFAEFRYGE